MKKLNTIKYNVLILDFDGTLADTKESIVQTMKFVANQLNIKDIDEKHIQSLIGLPLERTLKDVFSLDKKQIQEATLLYRKHYNEIAIDTITLFDGVKETLQHLYKEGIELTVASSKGRESLIKILKKHHVHDMFSFIGGEEDAKNKKPSPDIVHHIIHMFDHHPSKYLVIGDTVYDIQMGQNAHIATCGVTYGNNTKEELQIQKPNYLIDHFKSLLEIIKKNDDSNKLGFL